MTVDCLTLTVYFGESDRHRRRLLSDVLLDVFERRRLHASMLLRAAEGFGLEQHLRTDRFLSLSDDLPLVAVAVDERAALEASLPEVVDLVTGGLVTLERARLVRGDPDGLLLPEETKATIYLGRDERDRGRPLYRDVVDHLRRHGAAGATVLVGVDGTVRARRRRARFFSHNRAVPAAVVSIGSGGRIAAALAGLAALVDDPIVTLERVRVCKREGVLLAQPEELPTHDETGLALWQKLTVYAGEQSRCDGRPLHLQLIRRLREERAGGATSLRGLWGFSGDHAPYGDRLFRLRRQVPVVTTVIDRSDRIRRWFDIVDECTAQAGLVTSELVPAYQAVAGDRRVGGLALAHPRE